MRPITTAPAAWTARQTRRVDRERRRDDDLRRHDQGIGEKLSVSGGPTLSLDAGTVTISTTFRQASNGDLIFVSQELSGLHGPHPDLVSQFDYV